MMLCLLGVVKKKKKKKEGDKRDRRDKPKFNNLPHKIQPPPHSQDKDELFDHERIWDDYDFFFVLHYDHIIDLNCV